MNEAEHHGRIFIQDLRHVILPRFFYGIALAEGQTAEFKITGAGVE